jgi:hypothetical protein
MHVVVLRTSAGYHLMIRRPTQLEHRLKHCHGLHGMRYHAVLQCLCCTNTMKQPCRYFHIPSHALTQSPVDAVPLRIPHACMCQHRINSRHNTADGRLLSQLVQHTRTITCCAAAKLAHRSLCAVDQQAHACVMYTTHCIACKSVAHMDNN